MKSKVFRLNNHEIYLIIRGLDLLISDWTREYNKIKDKNNYDNFVKHNYLCIIDELNSLKNKFEI